LKLKSYKHPIIIHVCLQPAKTQQNPISQSKTKMLHLAYKSTTPLFINNTKGVN